MEHHDVLQQKLQNWCAASVRALSNQTDVHFKGRSLIVNNKPFILQASYLLLDFSTHDTKKLRGIADSIALRLLHSNFDEHQAKLPDDIVGKIVFELLEQLRCESLVPDELPGMRTNLRSRFLFWASQAATSSLIENSMGVLLFTIHVVCWSRLQAQVIPEQIENIIEATRWGFNDEMKHHLYRINHCCSNQAQFSVHALAIAKEVCSMIQNTHSTNSEISSLKGNTRELAKNQSINIQWLDFDSSSLEQNLAASHTQTINQTKHNNGYKIYTKAYDKILNAENNIRAAQLIQLRAELDKQIHKQAVNTNRVTRYLKQLIAAPQRAGWKFAQDEGYLDPARLARLITSPDDQRVFKREHVKIANNCVVSIVVDNSGSMNQHNVTVAALVDTFVKSLEMADIKTEVLGFTTTEWNGGRAFKEWAKEGRPKDPGRLTSTCHTIYKAADTSWRRSRTTIAGMLKTDLFREGIDGEALEWAVERIETRTEAHKIIMMISDGSPMEAATHAANSERYLDQHLTSVANNIERRPDIRLCALGVGLELTAYYRESMSLSLENELNTHDFFAMAELLTRAV